MNYRVIVTGAPGTGKTTLMHELGRMGLTVVSEPARQILAEQRASGGQGLPEVNPGLFIRLMRERAIEQYQTAAGSPKMVIFDRGMPDYIAYARLYNLDEVEETKAASEFRYHPTVFICPPWESIYTNDSERKMSFDAVLEFHHYLFKIYQDSGYQLRELPRVSVYERARLLLDQLNPPGM